MTSSGKSATRGIPYWKEKLAIMRNVSGIYSRIDLAEHIVGDGEAAIRISDNIRKWFHSRPSKKTGSEFFDPLPDFLGCAKGTTGLSLIESDLDGFIALLPEDKRAIAWTTIRGQAAQVVATADYEPERRATGTGKADGPVSASFARSTLRTVLVNNRVMSDTLGQGITEGHINQRHYYLDPDSASTWQRLVNADAYPTYDQCKLGLRRLVSAPEWIAELANGPLQTVLTLGGGGAPTKDIVLIKGILQTQKLAEKCPIDYLIVDISIYMLLTSMFWLDDPLRAMDGAANVSVKAVCGDMLNLSDFADMLDVNRRKLFVITGGTIGNVSESALFRSIESVSKTGDLLIISADTFDDDSVDVAKLLLEKYDHPDMQRFVAPVVRMLLSEMDVPESLGSALKRVQARVLSGRASRSDVDESLSVVLSIRIKDRDVSLLNSNRYRAEFLKRFAQERGWSSVATIPSPSNPNFVQFLFRRQAAGKEWNVMARDQENRTS